MVKLTVLNIYIILENDTSASMAQDEALDS